VSYAHATVRAGSAVVAKYIESFKDFPLRAKAASFTVADVMEKLTTAGPEKN
jgi:hypothetical protein